MKSWLKKLFYTVNNTPKKPDQELFDRAYSNRKEEIISLRKYDRGEKQITPSNLRKLVQSIR